MPTYGDFQAKIEFRPDIYNTFSLLMVNGGSEYDRDSEGAIEVGETEYGKLKTFRIQLVLTTNISGVIGIHQYKYIKFNKTIRCPFFKY